MQRKIEDVLEKDQFGFRKGKGTRDATGMLIISSERNLDMGEELCACFVDWMKEFDRVNWTKLILILNGTGIDRRERKLICNLYMNQSVKKSLDQGETRSVTSGGGDRVGWCLSPILFNLYNEYLTKDAVKGVGDLKSGGQVIGTMKYVDKLVLMSKKETVLQDMFDRLTEIGRFCGLEMNV
jgi:hypothetical protein